MSRSIPIRNTSVAHHYFASAEEALACAERYFEALTSETEELALKCYAASDEAAADARFDELRAVMGLAAMGRRLANKDSANASALPDDKAVTLSRQGQRMRIIRPKLIRLISTAAACVLVALIGTMLLRPSEQECVAYISGNRTTDPQQVLQAMQQSIDQMEQADKVPSVENQLNDMFRQLTPEQVK